VRTAPRRFYCQRTRGRRPSGPSASRSLPHVPLLSSPRTSTLEQLSYTQPPNVRNGLYLPSEGEEVTLVLTSRRRCKKRIRRRGLLVKVSVHKRNCRQGPGAPLTPCIYMEVCCKQCAATASHTRPPAPAEACIHCLTCAASLRPPRLVLPAHTAAFLYPSDTSPPSPLAAPLRSADAQQQ